MIVSMEKHVFEIAESTEMANHASFHYFFPTSSSESAIIMAERRFPALCV